MMTKEELLKEIDRYALSTVTIQSLKDLLDEFFKDKVIIQRSEKSAYSEKEKIKDMLEPIEAIAYMLNGGECTYLDGGTVIWNGSRFKYKNQDYGWSLNADFKYLHIKQKEPIYEWQWYYLNEHGYAIIDSAGFMTEDEVVSNPQRYKIENTKRERK